MMVVVRYISKVLVWILTVLVIIGSIGNLPVQLCFSLDGFGACKQTLSAVTFDRWNWSSLVALRGPQKCAGQRNLVDIWKRSGGRQRQGPAWVCNSRNNIHGMSRCKTTFLYSTYTCFGRIPKDCCGFCFHAS